MSDIPEPVSLAVHAVAILAQVKLESISDMLLQMMEPKIDSMLGKAAGKFMEMEAVARKALEGLCVVTQGVSDLTTKLAETSSNYHDTLLCRPPQPGLTSPSFLSHLPPRLKAREGIKARQVLMDFKINHDMGQAPFSDDSIATLKGKFDKTLQDSQDAHEFKIRAVTHLWNSGVLMELDSEGAVTWFTGEAVPKLFLGKLHPAASIKPQLFHIIVQFVPLAFFPDREADLREVEEANSINAGNIVQARWLKPVVRCKPSQTCGHLILSLQSPQPANDSLAYALFICHKKVYAEKCKWELLRCLKCHSWGHMVASCGAPSNICGTCALQHCTMACTNGDNPQCMSCKAVGHTSWDHRCPVFQQKCHKLNERVDNNNMLYFLTLKTWTQVMEPPRVMQVR